MPRYAPFMSTAVKPRSKVLSNRAEVSRWFAPRGADPAGWRVAHTLTRRARGGWVRAPQEARGEWGAVSRSRAGAPACGQLGGMVRRAAVREPGKGMTADVSLRAKAGTGPGCLAPPFIRVGVQYHHRAPDSLFAMCADPTRTHAPSENRLALNKPGRCSERCVHVSFSHSHDPSFGVLVTLLLHAPAVHWPSGRFQHIGINLPKHRAGGQRATFSIAPQGDHQLTRDGHNADAT